MNLTIPPIVDMTAYIPPKPDPLISARLISGWLVNFLTCGISSSAEAIYQRHRIKELKFAQSDMLDQIYGIAKEAKQLKSDAVRYLNKDRDLLNHMGDFPSPPPNLEPPVQDLNTTNQLNDLVLRTKTFRSKSVKINDKIKIKFLDFAFGIISLIGHLLANWCTVGVWGVITEHANNNRIKEMTAANKFILDIFNKAKEQEYNTLTRLIDAKSEALQKEQELDKMAHTSPGQALFIVNKTEKEIANLKDQKMKLEGELSDVKSSDYAATSQCLDARDAINELDKILQKQIDEQRELNGKNVTYVSQMQALIAQEKQVSSGLNVEITKLQNALKAQQVLGLGPEIQKIQPQLGPIPPAYTPDPTDTDVDGAIGIDQNNDNDHALPWSLYAKRYNHLQTTLDVLQAAVTFAVQELLLLVKDKTKLDSKIQFTGVMTPESKSLVYRYIILDLIDGAKLYKYGCEGYQLKINNKDVCMVPSLPVKVMRMVENPQTKLLEPKVGIKFTRHDDFTPDETVLQNVLPQGVDPVSLKWIYAKLTNTEKDFLKMQVLQSAYEKESNPKYLEMERFMRQPNDRVRLILTAKRLICDLEIAIEKKYGGILMT